MFKVIAACGGLTKSPLFLRTLADVCQLPVVRPNIDDMSVLLGAAMLGASAQGSGGLETIAGAMSGSGVVVSPAEDVKGFHDRKYRVFRALVEDQVKYRKMME